MLGVIIGVASVVAVIAVGAGAQAQIADQIRSLGSNVLLVYSTASFRAGSLGSHRTLNQEDVKAIVNEVPGAAAASPYAWSTAQVIRGNKNSSTVLWAITTDYLAIREWPLRAGRYFMPSEEHEAGKKVILGAGLAKKLFGAEDPVGGEVRLEGVPLQVIGVLAERGAIGASRSQDDDALAPMTTVNRRIKGAQDEVRRDPVEYILVKFASEGAMGQGRRAIETLLKQRHGYANDREPTFRIGDPAAQMAVQQDATKTFALLLASVASISLLVGGINIMNIMLVSVTERTREIGSRVRSGQDSEIYATSF